MSYRLPKYAALLSSAAFVFSASIFSASVFAQAPIVDASANSGLKPAAAPASTDASASTSNQSELFYQLQLLQQEVMQLRGVVEEQSFELNKLKEQNMERYIDLDRRLGDLSTNGGAAASSVTTANQTALAAPTTTKGEKDAYDIAYAMVTSRRFDAALDAFKQFLVDYPAGRYTPNAYYWLGELYQVVSPQDLEGARQAFTQLLEQYPDHSKVPDAMYKLGKVYFLKGNKAKSRHWLDRVIADYSKGSSSSAAYKAQQFINANF